MKTKSIIRKLRELSPDSGPLNTTSLANEAANRLEMLSVELKKTHAKLAWVTAERNAAVQELGRLSVCSTCADNGTRCHVGTPVAMNDVCCGGYKWRGIPEKVPAATEDEASYPTCLKHLEPTCRDVLLMGKWGGAKDTIDTAGKDYSGLLEE